MANRMETQENQTKSTEYPKKLYAIAENQPPWHHKARWFSDKPSFSEASIPLKLILFGVAVIFLVFVWENILGVNHTVVVYFGRPSNTLTYIAQKWPKILFGSFMCIGIAIISLVISFILALFFLVIGLLSDKWLRTVERFAAISQTVPILVIVTISYIIEKSFLKMLKLDLSLAWYCFVPVSIALFFPPLVYGINGIRNIDSDMKALLRVWDAPQFWRIKKIYLPQALPHMLTGLRVSSTWAVVATLITEGLVHGVGGHYSIGKYLMKPFSSSVVPGRTVTLMFVATLLGYFVYRMTGFVQSIIQKKFFGIAVENEKKYPISG